MSVEIKDEGDTQKLIATRRNVMITSVLLTFGAVADVEIQQVSLGIVTGAIGSPDYVVKFLLVAHFWFWYRFRAAVTILHGGLITFPSKLDVLKPMIEPVDKDMSKLIESIEIHELLLKIFKREFTGIGENRNASAASVKERLMQLGEESVHQGREYEQAISELKKIAVNANFNVVEMHAQALDSLEDLTDDKEELKVKYKYVKSMAQKKWQGHVSMNMTDIFIPTLFSTIVLLLGFYQIFIVD